MLDKDNFKLTKIDSQSTIVEQNSTILDTTHSTIILSSFQNYKIIKQFQIAGSEADIYLVKKESSEYILKLYRFGIEPKNEIVEKLKYLSQKYSDSIVKIYEIGRDKRSQRFYEIQEYIKNGSLKEISNLEIRDVATQINKILHTIHSQQIIHRDLKPSNILVREIEPLELIITDFGISSLKDSELSKIMTNKSGTTNYFSPESFSGIIGQEVDYWAFGITLLEIISRENIFDNIDKEMIAYTLGTKNIPIDKEIEDNIKSLLKGLLTRDPKKRWGYSEVCKWIKGESVEVFYDTLELNRAYLFEKKRFYSLGDLLLEFVKSEELWQSGKAHIFRGYITKWLENEGDFDGSVEVERCKRENKNQDLALLVLFYSYHREFEFTICGKKITLSNLLLFMQNYIDKKESRVVEYLLNGELKKFYLIYVKLTQKEDIYSKLFNEIADFYNKVDEIKRVETVYRYLEYRVSKDLNIFKNDYYLPTNFTKVELNIEKLYRLIKRVEFDNFCRESIVPNYLIDEIKNSTYSKYFKALESLKKLNVLKYEELEIYDNQIIDSMKNRKYIEYNRELKRLLELKEYIKIVKRRKKILKLEGLNLNEKITSITLAKIEKIKDANVNFDDYNRLTSIEDFKNRKIEKYAKKLLNFEIKWTKTDSNIIKFLQKRDSSKDKNSIEKFMAWVLFFVAIVTFIDTLSFQIIAVIILFFLIVFYYKSFNLKQIIKNQIFIKRIEEVLG